MKSDSSSRSLQQRRQLVVLGELQPDARVYKYGEHRRSVGWKARAAESIPVPLQPKHQGAPGAYGCSCNGPLDHRRKSMKMVEEGREQKWASRCTEE